MRVLVVAAALVAFGAVPALAEGGCSFGHGTSQSVQVDTQTQTQTQTASTQPSTVQSEAAK